MTQQLFDVGLGLSLDGEVAILKGAADPSLVGVPAPVGSVYLRTNGELWQKYAAPDLSWRNVVQVTAPDQHNLDGGAAFTVFDPATGIDGGSANG